MANYPGYFPVMQSGYQQTYYQQTQLSGRMVTSREEALGVPVDMSGGVTVMPDLGHGVIYTKVFNQQTGAADFIEYRRVITDMPVQSKAADALEERVNRLEMAVRSMMKPVKEGAEDV